MIIRYKQNFNNGKIGQQWQKMYCLVVASIADRPFLSLLLNCWSPVSSLKEKALLVNKLFHSDSFIVKKVSKYKIRSYLWVFKIYNDYILNWNIYHRKGCHVVISTNPAIYSTVIIQSPPTHPSPTHPHPHPPFVNSLTYFLTILQHAYIFIEKRRIAFQMNFVGFFYKIPEYYYF